MSMIRFGAFMLATMLLSAGCTSNVIRGETTAIDVTYQCYFPLTGSDSYVRIPAEIIPLLQRDATWSVSDGLILGDTSFNIASGTVSWESGNKRYSAEGLHIRTKASVRVTNDSTPGEKKIYLKLPMLAKVASTMKASPRCPMGSFHPPDTIEITHSQQVFVYESESERSQARTGQWVCVGIVVAVILVVLVVGALHSDN